MLHFQATKKLLNTSRIEAVLYQSEPGAGQQLHNWYVVLCGSGFPGKLLLLYVHNPLLDADASVGTETDSIRN